MIWREQSNHSTDCYFCMANISGISYKTRSSIKYPDVQSVSKPIPHDPVVCPIPRATASFTIDKENQEESDISFSANDSDSDSDYKADGEEIRLINYAELCDLVRDLALKNALGELLGS